MSDDEEEFSFRPAKRTESQKKQGTAPLPLAARPIPADHPDHPANSLAPANKGPPRTVPKDHPSHALANVQDGAREHATSSAELQKLLLDQVIMKGDNADLLSQRIRQEQAKASKGASPWGERSESICGSIDLSNWPHNKPLLVCAAEYGRLEIVKALVTEFKCAVNVTRPKDLNTALHCAAYYGHNQTVRALIRMGANVASVNKYQERPLQAAKHGEEAWRGGEHRKKNQGPFAVCFDQLGLEPDFEDCIAVLEGQDDITAPET